ARDRPPPAKSAAKALLVLVECTTERSPHTHPRDSDFHQLVLPPSTAMTWPWTKPALPSASRFTTSATSSGLPSRPSGIHASRRDFFSSGTWRYISVSIGPGATQLTLTPWVAISRASARVKPITAAFAAPYAVCPS